MTIFCYLKIIKDVGIIYRGEQRRDFIIKGYSNSNWAGDYITKKAISRFIFILNSGSVSQCLKCPITVALSSTKAEYVALILASKKAIWLKLLLTKLGLFYFIEQYAKIKFVKRSTGASEIKSSFQDQEIEEPKRIVSKIQDKQPSSINTLAKLLIQALTNTSISLKSDN